MDKKIKINKKTYKSLVQWRENRKLKTDFITSIDMFQLTKDVDMWLEDVNTLFDNRNRMIAIIEWLNGKDVFEIEKPKKWIVRSKDTDEDGDYHYVDLDNFKNLKSVSTIYGFDFATKFDTKEEAQSWANAHQEVVEVEE